MDSGVIYHDNQVSPSRAQAEHKVTDYSIHFLKRTDQPNCHIQSQDCRHQNTRNTTIVPNSPHAMQVKEIKGPENETKKIRILLLR